MNGALGLTLRAVLRGQQGEIRRIAWSNDGRLLVVPNSDKSIGVWDVETDRLILSFPTKTEYVYCAVLSIDNKNLIYGTRDPKILRFNITTKTHLPPLLGHESWVNCLSYSPDGLILASGSEDATIRLWSRSGAAIRTLGGHSGNVNNIAWSPDGRLLASVSGDRSVMLWAPADSSPRAILSGHDGWVFTVAWAPDGRTLITGSLDKTIRVWDVATGACKNILEGHTGQLQSVSISRDGKLLASKSADSTVRLWRCDTWEPVTTIEEPSSTKHSATAAFHPLLPRLASLGEKDRVVRIWDLDISQIFDRFPERQLAPNHAYTTARVALLGDSGVGKTGLGWCIAHGNFREHASTHGQQFWIVERVHGRRDDGAECEVILWDLAGQPDYRLTHALFLDQVDLGLLLFDPTNRDRPLAGVEYWLRHLRAATSDKFTAGPLTAVGSPRASAPTIVVAARTDRGTPTLRADDIEEFCERHGIAAYVATSARDGVGLDKLVDTIETHILWNQLAATTTTHAFKKIKEHVLRLKESGRGNVLLRAAELRAQLEEVDPAWLFSDTEMMTAVGHLASHGYVGVLKLTNGEQAVLLAPDLLGKLASSIVLEARRQERGLGLLDETRLLSNWYSFPELVDRDVETRAALLDVAIGLFLRRNLCFRETVAERTCLVFPSLINERRPPSAATGLVDHVAYRVVGEVETVYAALVVQLGYTGLFRRDHRWQHQAQYELEPGEICGFRESADREGEIELVLSYSPGAGEDTRRLFQGAFERFLKRRKVHIRRLPAVACESGHPQERAVVVKAIEQARPFFFCDVCGSKVTAPKVDEIGMPTERHAKAVLAAEEMADNRTEYEVALSWVKAYRRDRGDGDERPTCFLSYAWGNPRHEQWVEDLADHLRNSDVAVVFDRWHNRPGASITRFIELIEASDWVCAVGTTAYKLKDQARETDPVVQAELRLIKTKLRKRDEVHNTVIPLLFEGTASEVFPPLLEDSVFVDFRDKSEFLVRLFDLVLTMHRVPADEKMARDHRSKIARDNISQ